MHFQIDVSLFIAFMMISWVSCEEDCGNVQLQELHGEFTSPNYPDKYDHGADCSWTITAPEGDFIHVTFEDFDVKSPFWVCTEDYVTVIYNEKHSEKFCNIGAPPPEVIKSTTNTLTFKLKSDRFFSNGDGFRAEYYVVDQFGNRIAGDDEDEDNMNDDSTTSSSTTTAASTTTTTNPTTTTKATTTTKPTTTTTVSTTTKPTTTTTTTTTTVSTTTKPTTATTTTTKKTTKSPKITSVLITKLVSSIRTQTTFTTSSVGDLGSNDLISSNPGAMSGVLIGGIIGSVLVVFGIILFIAFVRYRRNINKRIDLSVIEIADGKELISDDKVYKKQGKKIVRVPEAETFPL